LPRDAQDHQGDDQCNQRVGHVEAGGDDPGAGDDGQADEPVDSRMVAVGD
jgi:hypothetical protein